LAAWLPALSAKVSADILLMLMLPAAMPRRTDSLNT
jgi:hypothetical protein